ncbi:hypothetical protein QYF36_012116 [Acer negundo]|nr:hypothetical protein QYF36_012116 [Acer negundo]
MCDKYMQCGANAICNEDTLAQCACLPGFERLYPQDWYLKCQETRKEACGKGDGEGFVRLEGVKFPDARNSTLYSNMSLEECERECLKSCKCTGYANVYVDELGRDCIAWYGELRDMRYYKSGQDFYLRVDAVELAADAQKNTKVHVLATTSTLVFVIVPLLVETLLAALCFYYFWRRNAKRNKGKKKQQRRQMLLLDSERSLSNYRDSSNANSSASESAIGTHTCTSAIASFRMYSSSFVIMAHYDVPILLKGVENCLFHLQATSKEACGKGDGEGFVRLKGVKFPDTRNSTLYSNMSLEECERECLKSCNCTGYANVYVDEMGRGCIAWYGELRYIRRFKSGQDFYLRVTTAERLASPSAYTLTIRGVVRHRKAPKAQMQID